MFASEFLVGEILIFVIDHQNSTQQQFEMTQNMAEIPGSNVIANSDVNYTFVPSSLTRRNCKKLLSF